MKIFSLILLASTLCLSKAMAQTDVTTSYQLGFGQSHVLDTYLSQEHFSGPALTLLFNSERQKSERRWSTQIENELNFSRLDDRSGSCSELQGDYTLFLGRLRRWPLGPVTLQAGGVASVNVGFIYNLSNSNNPAQGRLSLHLMPSGAATCHFSLFSQSFSARYEVQLPLAGVMFSPNYGQSYYEIFSRGNYDHNIVPTTFISSPTFRQQLSLDWHIRRFTTLRIGYLGHYQQASVNNLKSHIYHHRLMIGIVRKLSVHHK